MHFGNKRAQHSCFTRLLLFIINKSLFYHLRILSIHVGLEDSVEILLQSDPALLKQLGAGHHSVGLPGEPGQGRQSRVHLHYP